MVAWFKHDIPAWMDGTEALDDGPYRAYHVICQLIYLNEGPIALNEHGIAGRCRQHILAFRRHLKVLINDGKVALIDGRLSNNRAATELQLVNDHRTTSAKGGRNSGGVAKGSKGDTSDNPLKDKETVASPLLPKRHQETRLDETRLSSAKRPKYTDDFEAFWSAYPNREGGNPKPPSAKLFAAAIKNGTDPKLIIESAKRFAVAESRNINTKFIPQTVKWLRDQRWLDYEAGANGQSTPKFDIRSSLI